MTRNMDDVPEPILEEIESDNEILVLKYWCYALMEPIDYWYGLKPLSKIKDVEILARFEVAKEDMKVADIYWEGDIRGDAYAFFLPYRGHTISGFVWKQDNNGSTFVWSPVALSYLDTQCSQQCIIEKKVMCNYDDFDDE